MQPIPKHEADAGDLQGSLNAFVTKQVGFDELRTQWIITLAEQPQLCGGALRLLYKQRPGRHLGEERTLSLKRIVEAAFQDGPGDWTVVFDEEHRAKPGKAPTPAMKFGPGDVLKDRFVLEKPLGSGGVGIVFRARDRLLQRANVGPAQVAVKVLREEFRTNPELLNVLQREAGHAQGLSHPNIVRVYDLHQHGETYFITMELLEGESLKDLLSKGPPAPLSRDRAVRIILGMCRGLAYAHGRGLIHADFKPGNVILAPGDEPKILDFGLAHAAEPFGPMGGALLRAGNKRLRAVTPTYASCNRLEGGTPGFSDDVYSLCCVIYELLAGKHPYARRSALVARALELQPERIDGLTDIQWRTLATGLRPAREDRTTEVHDLQVAFSPLVALPNARTSENKSVDKAVAVKREPAKKIPKSKPAAKPQAAVQGSATQSKPPRPAEAERAAVKTAIDWPTDSVWQLEEPPRKRRWRGMLLLLLLAATAMWATSLPGLRGVFTEYVDSARQSSLLQSLQSRMLGWIDNTDASASNATSVATVNTQQTPQAEALQAGPPALSQVDGADSGPTTDAIETEPVATDAIVIFDAGDASVPGDIAPPGNTSASATASAVAAVPEEIAATPTAEVSPGFALDASTYVVREGAPALAVTINRQGDASGEASVEWVIVPLSAQPQQDYVGADRNRALFAAGEKSKTLFIPIVADAVAEWDEEFRIALSRPDGNRILADPFTATVTIVDDDR